MPLPPIDELCKALDDFPSIPTVQFPGGATLVPQVPGLPPSLFALAQELLGQTNTALAPLNPLFNLIEAIVAIQKCLTAVVDALGPPPDPAKLVECLPGLAEKIEKIITLLPPTSIVKMVADIVDTIIAMLEGMIAELRAVAALAARVGQASAMMGQAPGLGLAALCGQQTVEVQLANIARALASLNLMLGLVNQFAELAGLSAIAPIAELDPDPTAAISALQGVTLTLHAFRDSIPVS